jgi:malate dehydrogenase (oxaloacetate-decarboxylating)(NADP+)
VIAIAFLFVCVLCDCFKSRRLEAEILVLRHQLSVLQQRTPHRLHLRWADRALFIWLYRRYPRILDAVGLGKLSVGFSVRHQYGLEGLLPHSVESVDRRVERVMEHLDAKPNDLECYIYLIGLSDRNETLFYRAVMSDPARFIPILYDPAVADACLAFGHIYRRARRVYITREMKGRIAEVLRNCPEQDVRFICVSTGGRILGRGDIGANGMGIPIGSCSSTRRAPPCHLAACCPSCSTSARPTALRADPLYLGLREKPPSDQELDELAEDFVQAVRQVFPGCCIHFEDWKGTDAIRMLERYVDKVLCDNDDIQGTASIALAGLTTALQIIDAPLRDQRILFWGPARPESASLS